MRGREADACAESPVLSPAPTRMVCLVNDAVPMTDTGSRSPEGSGALLIEDSEQLTRFISTVPSLVAMLDTEGRILAQSDRWDDLFLSGLSSVEAETEDGSAVSFFDVFDDVDGAWADTFAASLSEAEVQRGYVRPLTRRDETNYWVDWEVRPWHSPDADANGLLLYLTDRTGQHRAEVTRHQIEQRFDALVDTVSEGVLLMDDRGYFRDCNEAAEDILGRSSDDIVGTRFDDESWRGLREDGSPLPNTEFPFWRAYVERETVPDEVMGIYPPDAAPRWIRVNAQPLCREDEDDPYAVLICFDDVTDEKLKEEALQTSRDLLSSVLSSSLDAITVLTTVRNNDEQIVGFECKLVNPQAEKLLGGSAENLVGHRLRRLMPEQEEVGLFDAFRQVVTTGEPVETEVAYDTGDGQEWFKVMVVAVGDGVAVTFRDITERKNAEQRIRDQAQLLDKARDAILAHDMDGRIVYWNKSAERLTGWSKEKVLGERVHSSLFDPNDEETLRECRETMMEEEEWTGELRMRTKENEERVVESRWTLVRDSDGAPDRVLIINTDITERKRLESQFLRSQRMESIGRLVGGIAHDLGNLLMPITLGVKVLRGRLDRSDDKINQILSMIQKSAKRGSDMVEQVLAFARGVEGERVSLQLEGIMDEIESIAEETFPESIDVITQIEEGLPQVVGDATQLQQVLMNLCVNARDAMPDGGTITVEARPVEITGADAERNFDAEPGRYVRLRVEDTGQGIPEDVLDKIFEPFFSTKEEGEGTGLGLSTAYSIVQSHDGFIDVKSTVGEGTTFSVYLPVSQDDAERRSVTGEGDAMATGNGERVLVVDDEEFILETTREALRDVGYRARTASGGEDALEVIADEEVDVVVTDLRMPGMDGYELIRRLTARYPALPVIAASGVADGRTDEALDAGAQTFLAKPFTTETLQAALNDALHADEAARP